jgi:transposase
MPQRDPKAGEVKEGAVTGEQMLMTNQQPAELTKPSCSSFHCRTDASDRAEAEKCPQALPLMTHPGVGALTALAFVPTIGEAQRFQCGKQVGCYWGLVPFEDSSGEKRRLGHITKQGNSLLRCLWEAARVASRRIPEWHRKYIHSTMRRGRKITKSPWPGN